MLSIFWVFALESWKEDQWGDKGEMASSKVFRAPREGDLGAKYLGAKYLGTKIVCPVKSIN